MKYPYYVLVMLLPLLVTIIPLSWLSSNALVQPYLELSNDAFPILNGVLGTVSSLVGAEPTYDYVIVGGGTAGSTLGSRLSESGFKVAIIEKGVFHEISEPILSTTPGAYEAVIGTNPQNTNHAVDWGIVTTPQSGANNRQLHYAQGRCLGGSSALNAMVYQRGSAGSYNKWADILQDESYRWSNILPYFKKSVKFTPPDVSKRLLNATTRFRANAFTSSNPGPVQVSYTNHVSPFATWVKAGLEAMGLSEATDFNSGKLSGTQYNPSTINPADETRSSSEAFLKRQGLRHLHIYDKTLVKRVLFTTSKQATGVEVETEGLQYHIRATREVILSAGAFHSPQILMVSGIGPAETLNGLNIPLISDLPGVGQGMWDHPFFAPSYRVNMDTATRSVRDPANFLKGTTEYILQHQGIFTNVPELMGWEKLPRSYREQLSKATLDDLATLPDDWPEVEYLVGNGFVGNLSSPIQDQPADGHQYASIFGILVAPTSRGNVTISSGSTSDRPVVNPNWLTTKTDTEVAIALYRRLRDIWHGQPLQSIVTANISFPEHADGSDDEILQYIRNSVIPIWHPACTCKMGKHNDAMAVLDSSARVYGVQRLRVVDASSFPSLPPGHPQSTVCEFSKINSPADIKT
ncbi:choline dehydrogenase [Penicillium macrosclerotiorum]|uniref:choline dehydrogenase n=1 Tax=Penicillium macrosclerotiorum TaxID=303699 RepID=UPI002548DF04|nr:choline dehydrogenase [Penicillium macrosclerotiorum]KAJ5674268.1 choline dehydrogenase [Penicillium macrosclerotiorum]